MNKATPAILAAILVAIVCFTFSGACSAAAEKRPFEPRDVHRIADVGSLALSPDGQWAAYSVTTNNVDKDTTSADLFMVSYDGATALQLTHTRDSSESQPRFSPDGRYLAFLAARTDGSDADDEDDPAARSQVWLMHRAGGEARRLTGLPGGVSGFEWAPDSKRLVLVSTDPAKKWDNGADEPAHDTPPPVVIDRYKFKEDYAGYVVDRYTRLYLFDIDSGDANLLTPGPYDSAQPAWSPAGDLVAFVSKREGDPDRHQNSDIFVIEPKAGAQPRQLTTWEGEDSGPVFSPDGGRIAYLQGGPHKYAWYDPAQPAVVTVAGGEVTLPASELDRNAFDVQWSQDGKKLYFLVEDDRVRALASVPVEGGKVETLYPSADEPGVVYSFAVGAEGIVTTTSFPQRPTELYRIDGKALSDHNRALLDEIEWATVEAYDAVGADGVRVGSMLLKPPGYRKGKKYPLIAHIHGGPVDQDGFEFDVRSQALAARGYLVVNPNYRGSSGRGRDFSRAIYADWGNLEIRDIHTVVDKLVADGLVDSKRMGIGGWSYGGINTNFAIATDTRFAAAFSGSGAANYIAGYGTDQYVWQYENEVGLPWEKPEAYFRMSYPFFHADRIKTPTLFMCGALDFNVPVINSEQMYQALRSLNVPTQLVVYPGEYHGLSKPSYIQDRLERMTGWFDKYLGKERL